MTRGLENNAQKECAIRNRIQSNEPRQWDILHGEFIAEERAARLWIGSLIDDLPGLRAEPVWQEHVPVSRRETCIKTTGAPQKGADRFMSVRQPEVLQTIHQRTTINA